MIKTNISINFNKQNNQKSSFLYDYKKCSPIPSILKSKKLFLKVEKPN